MKPRPYSMREGVAAGGSSPPRRTKPAWSAIRRALAQAVGLAIGLLMLAGVRGEIRCLIWATPEGQGLHLDIPVPQFTPMILTMLAWDLLLAMVAAWGLHSSTLERTGRRGLALLGMALSLALWGVVAGRIWALATGAPGLDSAAPADLLGWWVLAVVTVVVKEPIAQTLQEETTSQNCPLLGVFVWHHRKDWVVPTLGAVGLTLRGVGLPPSLIETLLNLAKIWLLGGAAWSLGMGYCQELLAETSSAKEDTCLAWPSGHLESDPHPSPPTERGAESRSDRFIQPGAVGSPIISGQAPEAGSINNASTEAPAR